MERRSVSAHSFILVEVSTKIIVFLLLLSLEFEIAVGDDASLAAVRSYSFMIVSIPRKHSPGSLTNS